MSLFLLDLTSSLSPFKRDTGILSGLDWPSFPSTFVTTSLLIMSVTFYSISLPAAMSSLRVPKHLIPRSKNFTIESFDSTASIMF